MQRLLTIHTAEVTAKKNNSQTRATFAVQKVAPPLTLLSIQVLTDFVIGVLAARTDLNWRRK